MGREMGGGSGGEEGDRVGGEGMGGAEEQGVLCGEFFVDWGKGEEEEAGE